MTFVIYPQRLKKHFFFCAVEETQLQVILFLYKLPKSHFEQSTDNKKSFLGRANKHDDRLYEREETDRKRQRES